MAWSKRIWSYIFVSCSAFSCGGKKPTLACVFCVFLVLAESVFLSVNALQLGESKQLTKSPTPELQGSFPSQSY